MRAGFAGSFLKRIEETMMKKIWIGIAVITSVAGMAFAQTREQMKEPPPPSDADVVYGKNLPAPTHSDVAYGSHSRHVMDLWLAPSGKPTPMLVNIHGGGYIRGNKTIITRDLIETMNQAGISVASIHYRLTEKGLFAEGKHQYPVPMHDGARAVQFLRYNANKYNLDKTNFAATGGSAGGCILMWLGFHPDLAQPEHKDPVLRESTRLQALAPRLGQTTHHHPTRLKWFGVKSLNASRERGVVLSSSEVPRTAEQDALSLDASPITHLTPDDPPIYLSYNRQNVPVNEETFWGIWVHHPIMGIKLKEAMDELGMECYLEYTGGPPVPEYESLEDFVIRKLKSPPADAVEGTRPASAEVAPKWKTVGFKQANSMGGGEAEISKEGKFRVFVLMGQSNMHGLAQATELTPPYSEKHDRIRIWANGRWECFVPRMESSHAKDFSNRFGPGVSMAHQLADYWPNDTIGIIKISDGGVGVRAFEKNWSFERAERTFDGKKGSFYKDLMNAVAEANRISEPEFSGFVWKQGGADGTRKDLAYEYFDTFKQLVSDMRSDLGAPDLPVILPLRWNEEELLEVVLSLMNDEEVLEAKKSAISLRTNALSGKTAGTTISLRSFPVSLPAPS
jgi:acetyl esterase/lipase